MQKFYKTHITTEIHRKAIHLLGVIFPVIYHFTEQKTMIIILGVLLVLSAIMDTLRIKFDIFNSRFLRITGLFKIFREHEKFGLSALTFAFVGMMICILISPKPVFNLAVCILTFSDTAAAIVGMLFGVHKINEKSMEGSAAFFATSCALSVVITYIYEQNLTFFFAAIFASLVATFVELFSKNSNLNDNMSIPISISIMMYILGY
jgi:dolichol kinase